MNDLSSIVRMKGLSKRFGKTLALDSIDLDVQPGTIVGLLGSNGAGKSTLIRHIIGLYLRDEGECFTLGCDAGKLGSEQLSRIGYVHQNADLLEWMSVEQLIRYVSAYYTTWNVDLERKFVKDFEIPLKKRIATLSPGIQQRVSILLAICSEPELLILDEPAAALDPISRTQFLNLLMDIIQDSKRTIIISSHILSDIEKIIDHAVIMHEGEIIRNSGFDELREEFCLLRLASVNGPLPSESPIAGAVDWQHDGNRAVLTVKRPSQDDVRALEARYHCKAEMHPLPLDEIFRIVIAEGSQKGRL